MSGVLEVMLLTIGLSFVIASIYRILTDPAEMKRLKSNMKELQAKVKNAQKSGNTEEMNALSSEMLKASQAQMSKNMKPMLASMLLFFVFIQVVGSLYGNTTVQLTESTLVVPDALGPVYSGTLVGGQESADFLVYQVEGENPTRVHSFDLDGDGTYGDIEHVTTETSGLFGTSWTPEKNDVISLEGTGWGNAKTSGDSFESASFEMFVSLPFSIPVFGSHFHWFWWYIIITVPFTFFFRKLLGVN